MNKKVLVTYSSQYGATKEIAEKIGAELRKVDLQVDVFPVDGFMDLTHTMRLSWGVVFTLDSGIKKLQSFYKQMKKPWRTGRFGYFQAGLWCGRSCRIVERVASACHPPGSYRTH